MGDKYPTGCAPGKLVNVGNFNSTDSTLNPWLRKDTAPFPLSLKPGSVSVCVEKGT